MLLVDNKAIFPYMQGFFQPCRLLSCPDICEYRLLAKVESQTQHQTKGVAKGFGRAWPHRILKLNCNAHGAIVLRTFRIQVPTKEKMLVLMLTLVLSTPILRVDPDRSLTSGGGRGWGPARLSCHCPAGILRTAQVPCSRAAWRKPLLQDRDSQR